MHIIIHTANGPSLLATVFMRVDSQLLRCVYANFSLLLLLLHRYACMYAHSAAVLLWAYLLVVVVIMRLLFVVATASATFTLTLTRLCVCVCVSVPMCCAFEHLSICWHTTLCSPCWCESMTVAYVFHNMYSYVCTYMGLCEQMPACMR